MYASINEILLDNVTLKETFMQRVTLSLAMSSIFLPHRFSELKKMSYKRSNVTL